MVDNRRRRGAKVVGFRSLQYEARLVCRSLTKALSSSA